MAEKCKCKCGGSLQPWERMVRERFKRCDKCGTEYQVLVILGKLGAKYFKGMQATSTMWDSL